MYVRLVLGLMGANNLLDGVKLLRRESPSWKQLTRPGDGIGHMIPGLQLLRVLWPVADEDAQIVHPCGGKENIIVVIEALAQTSCQGVKAGHVAELVCGIGCGANVSDDRVPPGLVFHRVFAGQPPPRSRPVAGDPGQPPPRPGPVAGDPGQSGVTRIRSSPPRSWTTNSGEAAGTATMPRVGRSTGSKDAPESRAEPAAANKYAS